MGGRIAPRHRRAGRRAVRRRRLRIRPRRRRPPGVAGRFRDDPAHRRARDRPRQVPGGRPGRPLVRDLEPPGRTPGDHPPACRRRRHGPHPGRWRGAGSRPVRPFASRAAANPDCRRPCPRRHARPAAWLRPRARPSSLGPRLRRSSLPGGEGRLAREARDVVPVPRPAGHRRPRGGQPARLGQRHSDDLAGTPELRRAGTRRPGRSRRLARCEALGRQREDRPRRLELRRLHDALRP